jgi:hypothetical protein
MIQELDIVVLLQPLLKAELKAGDHGTAAMTPGEGQAYVVEFMNAAGETTAIKTVNAADPRLAREDEITTYRQVA